MNVHHYCPGVPFLFVDASNHPTIHPSTYTKVGNRPVSLPNEC